jgi:hypothetical protein
MKDSNAIEKERFCSDLCEENFFLPDSFKVEDEIEEED